MQRRMFGGRCRVTVKQVLSRFTFSAAACDGTTEPSEERQIAMLFPTEPARIVAPDTVRVGVTISISVLTHTHARCNETAGRATVTRSGNTQRIVAYIRISEPVVCVHSGEDVAQSVNVVFPTTGVGTLRLIGRGGGASQLEIDSIQRTVVVIP